MQWPSKTGSTVLLKRQEPLQCSGRVNQVLLYCYKAGALTMQCPSKTGSTVLFQGMWPYSAVSQ